MGFKIRFFHESVGSSPSTGTTLIGPNSGFKITILIIQTMKHHLLTTIAAVLMVGCGVSQSAEPPTAKAPDISIHEAANEGNIEAVKQHLAAGTNVNARHKSGGLTPLHFAVNRVHKEVAALLIDKGADVNAKDDDSGVTPLHFAALEGQKEMAELLMAKGTDVNAKGDDGKTPLDRAIINNETETADLLRKHGGKTGEELKAEGK